MSENHQELLVQQIEEEATWMFARVIEKIATLNFSESMWEMIVSESMYPRGYSPFSEMGKAFAYISDSCKGTFLKTRCGWGVRADSDNMRTCLKSINDWDNQYSLTVDAQKVNGSEEACKIILAYVSNFAMYLNNGTSHFWNRELGAPNNKIYIVINVDESKKDVSIVWSKDKSTLTFSAPIEVKTDDWKEKIEIGLRCGWTIM